MLKKDYLSRQFEEFGKVLAAIIGLRKSQSFENYEAEMNLLLQKYAATGFRELESGDWKTFDQEVVLSEKISFLDKKIIASLLFDKIMYFRERHMYEQANELKEKCLLLLRFLKENQTENEYDLDIHFKLQQLSD